jgi:nicotinamidase-related amidase
MDSGRKEAVNGSWRQIDSAAAFLDKEDIMKALIVIDIQEGLTKKKKLFNENIFIDTVNRAVSVFHKKGMPVIFMQHNNNFLVSGTEDWNIDSRLERRKNDIIIQKHCGNSFQKTELEKILNELNTKKIVVCGLVSNGCIRATCMGGLKTGFAVRLLEKGHTNWNKDALLKIESTEKELLKLGVEIISVSNLF